ncbi:MAG: hypothetical protein CMM50_13080 [Rhodospirillaceae bacterium]|nr:hypothetical protein [Rhodospirillaceae bacterium]
MRPMISTAMGLGASLALAAGFGGPALADDDVTVIELTQTGCQFLEPEHTDQGYSPSTKADCEAVNEKTGEERLAAAETLMLKPGKYIFRVTNKDVPYELGFYLRAADTLSIPFKPKARGGGLTAGVTKDYEIDLEEGDYIYSCPLNPTPEYHVKVQG